MRLDFRCECVMMKSKATLFGATALTSVKVPGVSPPTAFESSLQMLI